MDFSTLALMLLPLLADFQPGASEQFASALPQAAPQRSLLYDASPGRQTLPHPQVVAAASFERPEIGRRNFSDAYYKRLAVHRTVAYAMLPLFALQYAAGSQLFEKSSDAPEWAKVGHRVGATGVALLFVTNLSTGIPNVLEARKEPEGRGRRTFHAVMMMAAAAGFTATGLIAERAEGDPDVRAQHRTVALSSMAVATIGYLSMLDVFRRD